MLNFIHIFIFDNLGGGFNDFCIFHPKIGKMIFDKAYFSNGWFNHQLVISCKHMCFFPTVTPAFSIWPLLVSMLHPGRLTWNIIPWRRWMEDHFPWKKWVIWRFHVNLPGCIYVFNFWGPRLVSSKCFGWFGDRLRSFTKSRKETQVKLPWLVRIFSLGMKSLIFRDCFIIFHKPM